MNRKDILTDFCIHLLLLGDEFRNKELQFFDYNDKNKATYENYVDSINKLISVEDFLWDTDITTSVSEVNTLNDIIFKKEIEFLQDYIKNEFCFGYPNEINEDGFAWGETYKLNFSIQEIESYFINYLDFKKYNPFHYITYYQQFLNCLTNQIRNTIETTKDEIDNFYNSKSSIDSILYSKLKDKLESKLETHLLNCTQNTSFQIQGGFDKYGFILNYDYTLKTVLKSYNSKYSKLKLDIESKPYYALVEYEYYLYKIEGKKIFTKTNELQKLEKEFESIKEQNSKQIQFLKDKNFDNREIDIILNCFSLNRFNQSNLRYIRNIKGINYFKALYFFYRFDFLKQENKILFNTQDDFNKLPITLNSDNIDCNQFKKYYDRVCNNINEYNKEKHHPFSSIDNTKRLLEEIKTELHIDINKLNIPNYLKKHL